MFMLALAGAFTTSAALGSMTTRDHRDDRADRGGYGKQEQTVQLGPRPFFLVEDMQDSRLKRKLQSCSAGPFRKSSFSIGHRGAALQFPEHTKESYEAGALMGAGILECDVTFTKDLELVCRHAQNDLQTTTNILVTPLASQCFRPFTPAVIAADGTLVTPATAECRTSDITLAEFKTLTGKMDAFNPRASTPQEFLGGTANFRTDLYAGPTSGHLLTHRESIALFKKLGVQMTPELKSPSVPMPFNGFTQEQYAQKMIDEYKASGVSPRRVWPQSFDQRDVLYWINREPAFGQQAVYLDDANTVADLPALADLIGYTQQGINIWAPPTFALLDVDSSNRIVPSQAARDAKAAGLDIITWTLERSGLLTDNVPNGFYHQTFDSAIRREGDLMRVIDVLARDVGILGVFSDWPAAVTYYANCMGLK
ncbi:MAG TPA: glycerophosphodiester phosphodiesterase family protein [Vicinamibacterales bacterium]|jgi:glycerophosphoryl diester phosphodiesterase|nr:glycerophosphodiester phosphodiesterase family protein [Vicinamibacterales bacterium]